MHSKPASRRSDATLDLKKTPGKWPDWPWGLWLSRPTGDASQREYVALLRVLVLVIGIGCYCSQIAFAQTPEQVEAVKWLNREVAQLLELGRNPEVLTRWQQVLVLAEKTLGPEHPDTATIISIVGSLYASMEQTNQALPLFQRALAIREKALGSEHPDTATSVNKLGFLYRAMGQYDQALALYQRSLAIREKVLGAEHHDTATSVNNLGFLHDAMGQYDQALPLYQRALAIREKVLGPEHPDTATSVNNLGALYERMGQTNQALPLFQRALAITEKVLGPEHPDTAGSVNNLGFLHDAMGQYDQALPLYQRALAIREKVLGPEHPDTATSVNNLGALYERMGQTNQALPLFQRALAITEKVLGPEHPHTATSVNNLSFLYQAMGQYDQALPLYQRALAIREKVLGPEHPDTATSVNNLGALYSAMGQYDQALPLYHRALAIRDKVLGPEHHDTATSVNNLCLLYQAMGQYDQALPLYQRAFRMLLPLPLPVDRGKFAGNLCESYRQRKASSLAIFYCKLAVNSYQQVRQGARSLDRELQRSLAGTVEFAYRDLAKLLVQEGRIAEAEQVLGMLKEYEFFEYVRRSETRDIRNSRADFTPEEKALADALETSARDLSRIYSESEALRKPKQRSPEQQQQLARLDEQKRIENERLVNLFDDIQRQLAQQDRGQQHEQANRLVRGKGATEGALKALQQLSKNTPALIYFLPEHKTTLFLIHTKDGLRQVQGGLGAQALNEKIVALRQAIEKRDSGYLSLAAELYEALITPVEPYLESSGIDMLMLYLTDALRYLPFAALYDNEANKHLIEKYPLAVYTHVGRDKLETQSQEQWSAVGLGTSQKTPNHPALPWVEKELKRVVRQAQDKEASGIMPGKRYLDNDFTHGVLMGLLNPETAQQVMHVATHFSLAPGNDNDSVLVLGNGDGVKLSEIAANAQLGPVHE